MTSDPVELDCRGMRCPLPIIRLANAMDEVGVGDVVVVVADDPAARPDIEAWCRMRGQQLLDVGEATDGTPSYSVRRVT